MAQPIKIVPNLYTAGNEFLLDGDDYQGAFHYKINSDTYWTYATPETGLEPSRQLVLKDPNLRDRDGYMITPYNTNKKYLLKLSRRKYQDVKDVIDTTISELAPEIPEDTGLSDEERIELLKEEFADLKETLSDEDLANLIREALMEHSNLLGTTETDEIVVAYLDVAHFGLEMRASDDYENPVNVRIDLNDITVFDGQIDHKSWRWYNFVATVRQNLDKQKIVIRYLDSGNASNSTLRIRKIKRMHLNSHTQAPNPDIVGEWEDPNRDLYFEYSNEEKEHIFDLGDDANPEMKDLFGKNLAGATATGTEENGVTKWTRYSNDPDYQPGWYRNNIKQQNALVVEIPSDWFLTFFPPIPVEFVEEDFQIGSIKNTKVELIETQTRLELQEKSLTAIKEDYETRLQDAEAIRDEAVGVSSSLHAENKTLQNAMQIMSEKYLERYQDSNTGYQRTGVSWRFTQGTNAEGEPQENYPESGDAFWRGGRAPKGFNSPSNDNDYWSYARGLLSTGATDGAPSEASGFPGRGGCITLFYMPTIEGQQSPAGWPNETQKIGITAKANNYKGWPKVNLYVANMPGNPKVGSVTVNSRDWKDYYFNVELPDVGIPNKNIELFFAFENDKRKWGFWNRNKTGRDRDVWIGWMLNSNGEKFPLVPEHNTHMDSMRVRKNWPSSEYVKVNSNSSDYKYMTAEWRTSNNKAGRSYASPPHGTYSYIPDGWEGRVYPSGKLNNNSGIAVTVPANSEDIFVKGEVQNPPPANKWAGVHFGSSNGFNSRAGIYLLPFRKYRFEICIRDKSHWDWKWGTKDSLKKWTEDYPWPDIVTSDDYLRPTEGPRARVFIGDTRNGWTGSPNAYPGTYGYQWSVSKLIELDYGQSWKKYSFDFIPVPGPQGGTRAYIYLYSHAGPPGKFQAISYSDMKILGPVDNEFYPED